jgi:hypothetical protein
MGDALETEGVEGIVCYHFVSCVHLAQVYGHWRTVLIFFEHVWDVFVYYYTMYIYQMLMFVLKGGN